MKGWRSGRLGLSAAVFLFSPAAALAHAPISGAGDVLNGAVHPLTVPAHVLILLGLALYGAQRSAPRSRMGLRFFSTALALGLALTATGRLSAGLPPPILIGMALAVAGCVAGRVPLRVPWAAGLFTLAACFIGMDSAAEQGTPRVIFKTLFGTWIATSLGLYSLTYYLSLGPRRSWVKIGVRVVASWIVAISLLLLAFYFRPVPAVPATSPPEAASPIVR